MNLSETQNLKKKNLALFFTCGISLKIWDEVGNLSRELKLYKELAKHFNKIYFFTYGNKEDLEYKNRLPENIEIVPKKINAPDSLYMLLLPFVERETLKRVDIYKTNQIKGGLAAVIAKLLYKKSLIARAGFEWFLFSKLRNKPVWQRIIIWIVEKIVYSMADKIIISSKEAKQFITKEFAVSESKILVIPNYIDTKLFKYMPEVQKEKGRICCIAKFADDKNLLNLIKALEKTEIRLVLIGSGEKERELKTLVKNLQVNVEFLGNVPNEQLPIELNKSELFILPSLFEGNPKVLLEAMACGLPVIGTDVVGVREIIIHKQNGYLCETNVESISPAIKEVLANPDLKNQITIEARKTIEESFGLESVLRQELSLYIQ